MTQIIAKCQYCNGWLDDRFDPDIHAGDIWLFIYPCEGCLKASYEEGVEEGRRLEKEDL